MSLVCDDRQREPVSNAERSRKCRTVRRSREAAAALAVARVLRGADAGDLSTALADWMERTAKRLEEEGGLERSNLVEIRRAIEGIRLSHGDLARHKTTFSGIYNRHPEL